jgi:hypothetical protein
VLPFAQTDEVVSLSVWDPFNQEVLREAGLIFGKKTSVFMSAEEDIRYKTETLFEDINEHGGYRKE